MSRIDLDVALAFQEMQAEHAKAQMERTMASNRRAHHITNLKAVAVAAKAASDEAVLSLERVNAKMSLCLEVAHKRLWDEAFANSTVVEAIDAQKKFAEGNQEADKSELIRVALKNKRNLK